MYVFKISHKGEKYKPLVILTLVVREESPMFKMLKDFAKEKKDNVFGLDTVFDKNSKISNILESVIKSKFNIDNEISLGFIKQIATNSNRLIKLIRMTEYDNHIKIL